MGAPDNMTEPLWLATAAKIGDGWEPGLVPCAGSETGSSFGWLKGSFGIFEGNADTELGCLELSSLTHLKSGMRIALFVTPDVATTAAELAERVGNWSEIGKNGFITNEWKRRAKEMYQLWLSAGMVFGPITTNGKGVWCAPEPIEKRQ